MNTLLLIAALLLIVAALAGAFIAVIAWGVGFNQGVKSGQQLGAVTAQMRRINKQSKSHFGLN